MSEKITADGRKQLIATSLAAAPADAERRAIPWRGDNPTFPIIKVPLTHVLLNPKSHRIKSQLMSLGSKAAVIERDPYGREAQELIAKIIRETSGFSDIVQAMRRDGQQDPGVITHVGILINANTRAVALQDIGEEYLKVQVLPEDATGAEITRLELKFQMQRDIKQPYPFTGRLLFIKDLLDAGMTPAEIGLEMEPGLDPGVAADRKKAEETIKSEARLLQIIDSILETSSGALSYENFNEHRQTLLEIDSAYEGTKKKGDLLLAERVKQAKITGMLAGLGYERVRAIDATYLDDYIFDALKEEAALGDLVEVLLRDGDAAVEEPGGLDILDGFDNTDQHAGTITLGPIFTILATTTSNAETVELTDAAGEKKELPKEAFQAAVRNAMSVAAETKERDRSGTGALELPKKQINAAAAACDRAIKALKEVKDKPGLDKAALRKAYETYLQSHDELELVLADLKIERPTDGA